MADGFADEIGSASHGIARDVIYVDGNVMMPTLRKPTLELSGIARAGLHVISSFLLDPTIASRVVVADRGSRRVLSLLPEDRTSEHGLMQSMGAVAKSLKRSGLQSAIGSGRDAVLTFAGRPWQLPPEWTRPGARGVFLYHGMNIHPSYRAALQYARHRYGLKIAVHLHDLLPLTPPPRRPRARGVPSATSPSSSRAATCSPRPRTPTRRSCRVCSRA